MSTIHVFSNGIMIYLEHAVELLGHDHRALDRPLQLAKRGRELLDESVELEHLDLQEGAERVHCAVIVALKRVDVRLRVREQLGDLGLEVETDVGADLVGRPAPPRPLGAGSR